MPVVAKFRNHGEAAFVQSLLEGEGIDSNLLDAGPIGGIIEPLRLEVSDADFARADELCRGFEQSDPERAAATEAAHFGKGFPFLGIWIFSAGLVFLVILAWFAIDLSLGRERLPASAPEWVMTIAVLLGASLLNALGLTLFIFFGKGVWRWFKARSRPGAEPSGEGDSRDSPPSRDS